MKLEFKNAPYNIKEGQTFFIYGNYRKTFGLFCGFVVRKLKEKQNNVRVVHCSMAEYDKVQSFSQCDLFETKLTCYCIKGIEDKHLEKIKNLPREHNVFILESGDYFKSKKATNELTNDPNILALASFNNNMTFTSVCNMILPKLPSVIYNEIVKIINETDEELTSLFQKLSLLLEDNSLENLNNYVKDKKSFLDDLEDISFIRFSLQAAIKENIFHQDQSYTKLNLKDKIHFLMDAEIKQKSDYPLNKNYLLKNLSF
ncbi:MAG: hypothetical protein J5821_04910 [Alphaproteobacteria bacterium]|nr:hypothetical protein [Alphaproteobacteria bacterium]